MKHRILLWTIIAVLAAAMFVPAALAEGSEFTYGTIPWNNNTAGRDPCENGHDYVTVRATEATCSQPGAITKVCSRCQKTVTETIPATGKHNFVVTDMQPATCGKEGYKNQVCTYCGQKKTDKLPATGDHKWSKWTTEDPATCRDKERQRRKCSVCGQREHRYVGQKGDHQYVETGRTPATCVTPGTVSYRCSVCGDTKQEMLPATGNHTFGPWETVEAPAPGKMGLEHRVCSVCGYVENRDLEADYDVLNLQLKAKLTSPEKEVYEPGDELTFELALCNYGTVDFVIPTIIGEREEITGAWPAFDTLEGTTLPHGYQVKAPGTYTVTEEDADAGVLHLRWRGKAQFSAEKLPKLATHQAQPGDECNTDYVAFDFAVKKAGSSVEDLNLTVEQISEEKEIYRYGDTLRFRVTLTNDTDLDIPLPEGGVIIKGPNEKQLTLIGGSNGVLPAGETLTVEDEYDVTEDDDEEGEFELEWILSGTPVKMRAASAGGMLRLAGKPSHVVTMHFKSGSGKKTPKVTLTVKQTSAEQETYAEGDKLTFEATLKNGKALTMYQPTVTMHRKYSDGQKDLMGTKKKDGKLATSASETFKFTYTVTEEDVKRGGFKLIWAGFALPGEPTLDPHTHAPIYPESINSKEVEMSFVAKEAEASLVLIATQSEETKKETYAEGDKVYIALKLMKVGSGKLDHPFILIDADPGTGTMRDVFKKADMTSGMFAGADNYTITKEDVEKGSVTLVYDGCAWKKGTFESGWDVTKDNPNLVRSNQVVVLLTCAKESKESGSKPSHTKPLPKPSTGEPKLLLSVSEKVPETELQLDEKDEAPEKSYTITVSNVGKAACYLDRIYTGINGVAVFEDMGSKLLKPGESRTTVYKHVFKAGEATPGTETETLAGTAEIDFWAEGHWKPGIKHVTKSIESNTVAFTYNLLKHVPKKGITGWTIPSATSPSDMLIVKAAIPNASNPKGCVEGDKIYYLIALRNTSKVDLDITLTDELGGVGTLFSGKLAAGKIRLDGFVYTITAEDASQGYVENQAKVSWKDPDSGEEITKNSNITVTPVIDPAEDKGLIVIKEVTNSPKEGTYFKPGEEIEFKITVKNPYDYEYLIVNMVDKLYPGCDKFGNFKTLYNFGKGDSETITFKYKVTDADADTGYVENVASARAIDGKNPVAPFPSNTVRVDAGDGKVKVPSLTCTKTEKSHPKNDKFYQEGETIEYTISVSNVGKYPVTNVEITDVLESDPTKVVGTIASIAPGATESITYKYVVTGPDVDALQVINAAVAHVKYDEKMPEYAVMSASVCSSTGKETTEEKKEEEKKKEDDLEKLITTGKLKPETPDKEKVADNADPGKTDLSKLAAAECCVRTLTGVGETETSYSLHYCPVHSPVAKAAEDLMSAAVTEEQQAEAWKKAADMWRAAIEEEYSRCVGASTGTAKAAFLMEKDAFDDYVNTMTEQLTQMHPDQPALVAEKIADLLRDRAAELCYEMSGGSEERADSVFDANPVLLDAVDLEDCTRLNATRMNGDLAYSEELCEEHAFAQETVISMMDEEMTVQGRLDAWLAAQAIWQSELDAMTNRHYKEADADNRTVIAAARIAFDQLLAARQATLDALYPDAPDVAAELLCQMIQRNVMILCEGWN